VVNLLASLAMLVCFFLPHSLAGDGQSCRPVAIVAMALRGDAPGGMVLIVVWPFAFAAATLLVTVLLVFLRPTWLMRALLGLPLATAVGLSILWVGLLFSGSAGSRRAMLIAAVVAPAGTFVAARMRWLCRAGSMAAAAAWGQSFLSVLAAFSLRWLWFPPLDRLRWGGMAAIAAAMLLMFASWTWTSRARYDLLDRSDPPLPLQVSLRQMVIAMALVAIALAYWQALVG
jgi:hypothetical protein